MKKARLFRFNHPIYGSVEVLPPTDSSIADSLLSDVSKRDLLAMWQQQDLVSRWTALHGFISRMPTDPVSQQVVRQALQDPTLCDDALYWIQSHRAISFLSLLAEAVFETGTLCPHSLSSALEVLSDLGYDFSRHVHQLTNWASRTATFDDVSPVVAMAILLKLRHPTSRRWLNRFLCLSDRNLLLTGLRILGHHASIAEIKNALRRFVSSLPSREDNLEIFFAVLEWLLSVPLSKRTLRQVCRRLEEWHDMLSGSENFKACLGFFYDTYLTRQGYPIGDHGEVLIAHIQPAPTNVSSVFSCVHRLLART